MGEVNLLLTVWWTVVPIMIYVIPTGETVEEVHVLCYGIGVCILDGVGVALVSPVLTVIPTSLVVIVAVVLSSSTAFFCIPLSSTVWGMMGVY